MGRNGEHKASREIENNEGVSGVGSPWKGEVADLSSRNGEEVSELRG